MNKFSVKQLLNGALATDETVEISGWVRSRRDSKAGLSFIALSDGSCFTTLQIVAGNNLENYTSDIIRITKDCSIKATGKIVPSLGGGQNIEILADKIEVIGFVENPDTYPVSPKRHTVEYLREVAHLRVRTNLIAAATRVRNTVCFSIHEYLQQNGFYWIHTPIITSTDCEGAGELFNVTLFDINRPARDEKGNIDYKQDFFGRQTYLTVSGQLNVEAYCMALSKVYTFGPTFRAENSNTTRHLAEFWMVEPEIAFANLMDNANLATDLLKHIFKSVLNRNSDDMKFFAEFVDKNVISRLEQIINGSFAMISYTEAINYLEKANKKFENPVSWGIDLASEHERWLCEEHIGQPTIVTDYPKDFKAFYMRQNEDGKTVAAMDILAPGIGEIVGGSVREERYDMLVRRMREMSLSEEQLHWYLDLRRFGSAPHAGFGLGLDRLINYITGISNIRDIIPFPRYPKSANF
ncbi:MAG: asparagine--tRNA ligase [Burkholderiales bacterium]|jgi:asparaginyl-tRNA synthetase|nr:asparagine--tRNA ligase [Burkholderiales bacterium]